MGARILDLSPHQYYVEQKKRLNYSTLKRLISENEIDSQDEFKDRDIFRFGRAFHASFAEQMAGKPVNFKCHSVDRRSADGKAEFLKLVETEYDFFLNDEVDEARLMLNRFFSSYKQHPEHKAIIGFFRLHGRSELSVLWENEHLQEFKSRFDYVVLDRKTATAYVMDLKTDGNLPKSAKSLYYAYRDKNYDLQMYVYVRALIACGYTKIVYYTLSIARKTGSYWLGKYGEFDFADEFSAKCEAFLEGGKKYALGLEKLKIINKKLAEGIALSSAMSHKIVDLLHPAYEGGY